MIEPKSEQKFGRNLNSFKMLLCNFLIDLAPDRKLRLGDIVRDLTVSKLDEPVSLPGSPTLDKTFELGSKEQLCLVLYQNQFKIQSKSHPLQKILFFADLDRLKVSKMDANKEKIRSL